MAMAGRIRSGGGFPLLHRIIGSADSLPSDSAQVSRDFASAAAAKKKVKTMGRGVSSGGGQSSLGYLFGDGEEPKPARRAAPAPVNEAPAVNNAPSPANSAVAPRPPVDITKQIPAGINSSSTNNYMRADGQNTGNFLTDRPSTKVHAAPGGGSSLGYLFGGAPGGGSN